MKRLVILTTLFTTAVCLALPKVEVGRSQTGVNFKIGNIPPPSANDAATNATFTVVQGNADPLSGSISALNDGKIPGSPDEPPKSFVFAQDTKKGRIVIDFGKAISIKSIHTYSWHVNDRSPQVYRVYTATGDEKNFSKAPGDDSEPLRQGWEALVKVDTRRKGNGGQHAVAITDPRNGPIGTFRYLLFEFERTDPGNNVSNTLINEIDVVEENGPAPEPATT